MAASLPEASHAVERCARPRLSPVDAYRERILPLRQRVDVVNAWLRDRLDNYPPELMAREGIDLWVINTCEYNEDPVVLTLMPADERSRAPSSCSRAMPMARRPPGRGPLQPKGLL